MIDLNKLSPKQIDAILVENSALPESIKALIPCEANNFTWKTHNLKSFAGEHYDRKSLEIAKNILDAKKELFADKSKKNWYSKPEGAKELMANYDSVAKRTIKARGEFTKSAKKGNLDMDRLRLALSGNTLEIHNDLGVVVAQSIELAYIKGEPLSKVLSERMKELGMISKEQAEIVSSITLGYENASGQFIPPFKKEKKAADKAGGADSTESEFDKWRKLFGKPEKQEPVLEIEIGGGGRSASHSSYNVYDELDRKRRDLEDSNSLIHRQNQQALIQQQVHEQMLRDSQPSPWESWLEETRKQGILDQHIDHDRDQGFER